LEISSIKELLDDLQFYSQEREEESRSFFSSLNALGVGPVRNLVSGACALEDLNTVCPLFFGEDDCHNPWYKRFDQVGFGVIA
jgi:hypothetical protein